MKVKRAISLTLIILLLFLTGTVMAQAKISATVAERTETEILPNGDSIETILVTCSRQDGAKSVVSGQKTKKYKDGNGAVLWSVTVYGTFSYNGSTASCTAVSHTTTCPGTNWSIVSSSSSKSGNTATAKATARYNNSNFSLTVSLKCSANGTLS